MKKLSVIIPTFNEENYIEKALRSVRFADEIIVVDSFSSDKTVDIAKKNNCTVVQRQFDNFSNQEIITTQQDPAKSPGYACRPFKDRPLIKDLLRHPGAQRSPDLYAVCQRYDPGPFQLPSLS